MEFLKMLSSACYSHSLSEMMLVLGIDPCHQDHLVGTRCHELSWINISHYTSSLQFEMRSSISSSVKVRACMMLGRELQLVTFDIEESPVVDINHVLPEPDMEKFTFDDISHIDSSTLEPEMETFIVDYDEVALDVKKPSSNISLVDTSPVEISTITPHLVSSIEVVLKLLPNYLRYDLSFLDKTCHIADIAYAPCDLLLIHVPDLINRYTYMIGYSIDDLEGILSITCIGLVVECSFRLMLVYHLLRVNRVRDDIPWDPGGFTAW
ncbi:unnamed protein product [Triticum turgidum subsp. durum]|uniref:Uncharacterized protein n=1 Tax=Triticum turgidum subsp. durum TaxID=4567 RepID=A0A9R0QVT6_TRITD|nr:unnamed protein product [Triticum turgidum subsp. durum]